MAPAIIDRCTRTLGRIRTRASAVLRDQRRRRPWFDHLLRAYERYDDRGGDHLAGAVTFFGFLSFFPLIALAFAVVGIAAQFDASVHAYVDQTIRAMLPGLADQLHIDQIHPGSTGVIGIVALLFTGIGWIEVFQAALHEIWLRPRNAAGNVIVRKATAIGVLVLLGVGLLASVAISSLATSATSGALRAVGADQVVGAGVAVRVLAIVIAIAFDTLVFWLMFARLSGSDQPTRLLLRGALFAAVGFEILKLIGTYLIGHTTQNPVYGAFAVIVGLLVWINFVARFTLFAAAWTATILQSPAPDPDRLPVPEDIRPALDAAVPPGGARPAAQARPAAVPGAPGRPSTLGPPAAGPPGTGVPTGGRFAGGMAVGGLATGAAAGWLYWLARRRDVGRAGRAGRVRTSDDVGGPGRTRRRPPG